MKIAKRELVLCGSILAAGVLAALADTAYASGLGGTDVYHFNGDGTTNWTHYSGPANDLQTPEAGQNNMDNTTAHNKFTDQQDTPGTGTTAPNNSGTWEG